jgi:hypothetical protein
MDAKKLSKWGAWKRGQRELPKKQGYVRHHKRAGTYGPPTSGNTVLIKRSSHAAHHNRLRRKS